jgi:hypothetical protein
MRRWGYDLTSRILLKKPWTFFFWADYSDDPRPRILNLPS